MSSKINSSYDSLTFNLPLENVDTDQIYPARYLTTTDRHGLGQYCFRDWRDNPASEQFRLFENLDTASQQILVAGDNFGCGSSREQAAWSLLDAGFKAVISTRFGDIFHTNAMNNGLLIIVVQPETLDFLHQRDRHNLHVDIRSQFIEIPGLGRIEFPLDQFMAYCLINGLTSLEYLLKHGDEIAAFEAGKPA